MTETDESESSRDLEAPEEELDNEQIALLHFSKYSEARHALTWEQWTFKEKANYFIDRIFLGFLAIFSLMVLGEFGYKMWYVTNMKKSAEFVWSSVVFLFNWLFTQERQEELIEL